MFCNRDVSVLSVFHAVCSVVIEGRAFRSGRRKFNVQL